MKQAFVNRPGTTLNTSTTQYIAPTCGDWTAASAVSSVSEAGERQAVAGQWGRLYIQRWHPSNGSARQVGVGITETFTLYVNNSSTSVVVSMSGTDTSGNYTTSFAASVSVGDSLTLVRTTSGGTPNDCVYNISLTFRGAVAMRSTYGGNFIPNSTTTRYIAPMQARTGLTGTSRTTANGSNVVAVLGDLDFHTIELTTAPGVGKSWTFKIYKDGVAVAGSAVTISDLATTGSASFSIPCTPPTPGVPGGSNPSASTFPVVSLEMTPSGTPATTRVKYGCRFTATPVTFTEAGGESVSVVDNLSNYVANPGAAGASGSDIYSVGGNGWTTVEAASEGEWCDIDGQQFGVALSDFLTVISLAPGGSATRRHTWRYYHETEAIFKDAAEGNAAATINPTETAAAEPHIGALGPDIVSWPGAVVGQTNRRFQIRMDVTSIPFATDYVWIGGRQFNGSFAKTALTFDGTVSGISPNNGPIAGGTGFTITGTGFTGTVGSGAATITGATITLNGIAATSVNIVNGTTITGTSGVAVSAGTDDVVITFTTDSAEGAISTHTMTDSWTYTDAGSWWTCEDPETCEGGLNVEGPLYQFDDVDPGDGWAAGATPENYGWWVSQEGMAGGPLILDGARVPKGPRTIADVAVFATGAAAHLQGNCACVFRNKLIYAARGYTVDTHDPPLRIYDGLSDRFLVGLPKDASLAPAEAVMSMLVANGTIYIATLDNNAGGGRVLQFDLDSLTFTPIGAAFGSGDVPYAMCWHMGRLWVGTNDGDGTAQAIYFIRPGIDSAFTTDRSLSTDTLGGVASMASYKGKLYVGCDNVSGQNGKILVRSELGAYSVSETGTGTSAMNGYVAMVVFNDNLYAAYWNSSGSVSRIRKFDNSSWSTVYTGASATAVPILALFVHDDFIYALFGTSAVAQLIRSDSGTSYTDLTSFLTPGTIKATPAYGSLRF